MAMNSTREGDNIAAAVAAISIPTSSAIPYATLQEIWIAIAGQNITELGNALVAPGSFTAPSSGGPVTGIGGGLS